MKRENPMQLLSAKETARLLSISVKSLWRLIHQRRIAVVRIDRRVLVSEVELRQFLDRHTIDRIDPDSLADDNIRTGIVP